MQRQLATVMATLLLFVSGCQKPPAQQAPGAMAMPVETMKLSSSNIANENEFIARIESRDSVAIYPRVEAPITRIYVSPGQQVAAGQILLALDATQQQAELASKQGEASVYAKNIQQSNETLKSSIALQQSSEFNVDYQTKQLKRYQNLLPVEAASVKQVQEATNATNQAQKTAEAYQHQVEAQRKAVESTTSQYRKTLADIEASKATLGFYTLRAPFAGTVGDVPVKIGDLVNAQKAVTTVTKNQNLQVIISVPADKAGEIHHGSKVRLVDAMGVDQGAASVYFISPNVDPASQTIVVRANIIENKGALLADQTVRVRLVLSEYAGLQIPTSAVTNLAGQDFVFIAEPSAKGLTAKQVPVQLGDIVGTNYVVKSGIKEGQILITSGIQKIQNGVPVQDMSKQQQAPQQKKAVMNVH